MRVMKKISREDRAKIVDLLARGHNRTFIAKDLKIKNKTLERICKEESIPLNPKNKRIYLNRNIELKGKVKIRFGIFNFFCDAQLYNLLQYENHPLVVDISTFDDNHYGSSVKVLFSDDKFINFSYYKEEFIMINSSGDIRDLCLEQPKINLKFNVITIPMINKLVSEERIIFFDYYLNKKFRINYAI